MTYDSKAIFEMLTEKNADVNASPEVQDWEGME